MANGVELGQDSHGRFGTVSPFAGLIWHGEPIASDSPGATAAPGQHRTFLLRTRFSMEKYKAVVLTLVRNACTELNFKYDKTNSRASSSNSDGMSSNKKIEQSIYRTLTANPLELVQ